MGRRLTHDDYTVACICPMGVELAPVEAMLDETHQSLPTTRDTNNYTLGRMGAHNVVIAVMPEIGNNSAATVATQLLNDFTSIRFGLLVGIGGGIPSDDENNIRLGDVVISKPTATFGGVVQFDRGKIYSDGQFERTGTLKKPPAVLMASVQRLEAQHKRTGSQISKYLSEMLEKFPNMEEEEYVYPGMEHDQLFEATYNHKGGRTCRMCDWGKVIERAPRKNSVPKIHYGTIGSSNVVIKDGITRERLREDLGILCVEMEAAGLMDEFSCLVIRGICDYSDSHESKNWRPYAAATAAAYAKELLSIIPAQEIVVTTKAADAIRASMSQHSQPLGPGATWSRTALHDAIAEGDENKATMLLKTGADINAHDPQGYTPLNLAIWNGNERMVKFLLDNKAQVEDSEKCLSALHAAIINGHKTIVELLLKGGADTERRSSGETPLSAAVNGGHELLVKLLLDRGALVDAKDLKGRTPLLYAVLRGHMKIVILLLQWGAKVDERDRIGGTPIKSATGHFHTALEQWSSDGAYSRMAKLLVDRSLEELDGMNTPAKWALHLAVKNNHETVVKSLLDLGAEVDKKNDAGKTPLDLAIENENRALVELLATCGGDEQYSKRRLHILAWMNNLALTYYCRGRIKEAEWLLVPVVKARKKMLGEEHLDTVTTKNILACCYSGQGRLKETEDILVPVMDTRERVLGEEYPNILTSMDDLALMNNLASNYLSQSQMKEAEWLLEPMVQIRKKVLGIEHPDTLTAMNNLAWAYYCQRQLRKAEEILLPVTTIRNRMLGNDHPDALTSMNFLALTYLRQGRFDEAQDILVFVVEARKRVLGEEDLNTLESMDNLAWICISHGRLREAELLLEPVVKARKKMLGEKHTATRRSMKNLAFTLQGQQRELGKPQLPVTKGRGMMSEEHLNEDRRNKGSIWKRILGTREP
jgi:ankyrin repeat protein/nucleoside phosphorylase